MGEKEEEDDDNYDPRRPTSVAASSSTNGGRQSSFGDVMNVWGKRDEEADGRNFLNSSSSSIGAMTSASKGRRSSMMSPKAIRNKPKIITNMHRRASTNSNTSTMARTKMGVIDISNTTEDWMDSLPDDNDCEEADDEDIQGGCDGEEELKKEGSNRPSSGGAKTVVERKGSVRDLMNKFGGSASNISITSPRRITSSTNTASTTSTSTTVPPPPPPPPMESPSPPSSPSPLSTYHHKTTSPLSAKPLMGSNGKRRSSLVDRITMFSSHNQDTGIPDIVRIGGMGGGGFLSPRLMRRKGPSNPTGNLTTAPKRTDPTEEKKNLISIIPKAPPLSNESNEVEEVNKKKEEDHEEKVPSSEEVEDNHNDNKSSSLSIMPTRRTSVQELVNKFKVVNETTVVNNAALNVLAEQKQSSHKSHINRRNMLQRSSNFKAPKKKNQEVVCATKLEEKDLTSYQPPNYSHQQVPQHRELIETALRNNFVFTDLVQNSHDLTILLNAFESISYQTNDTIIQQGDTGDYFYVIAQGSVTFQVNNIPVGTATKGKSFGELALLYTCPRAASVIAGISDDSEEEKEEEKDDTNSNEILLYRVDQTCFRYILQNQTQQSEDLKRQLLKGIPFAKQLSTIQMNRLCSVMTPRMFQPNEIVVTKGDVGDAFYVLADGTMRVTDISVGSVTYEDVTLSVGDYFGERALVTSEPRAANVSGITHGTAFSIDRTTFEKVLGNFAEVILRAQDRRKLEGIKIIKDAELTSGDLDLLSTSIVDHKYRRNYKIMQEGKETEPALYFVREGVVELVFQNGKRRERITSGGYFGEEQLLADATSGTPGLKRDTIIAEYSAVATTNKACVCGLLKLKDCRAVFDTSAMDAQTSGVLDMLNMDDMMKAMSKIMERRTSIRTSIQGNVSLDDLERHSILGEGQFGEVWLVSADPYRTGDDEMKQKFALKIQSKTDEIRKDVAVAIQQEIDVIQKLNHPFIVDLVTTYECDESIYMLLGLVKGGELWNVIHKEDEDGNWTSGLSELQAKFYGLIIADTLAYMHRQNYIFRDLKPENVMIDDDGYPIIVDFGFAKCVPEKTFTFCGTPNYLAPEIVMNRGHAAGADHWALGILIYEMVSGENPFYYDGMDQMTLFQAISTEPPYPLPETVSPELINLCEGLLNKDPTQRLGMLAGGSMDILTHTWFDGLELNKLRGKEDKAPWIPES